MNPSTHPASNARRAFTLIELLTVIAIIGILAAILIPVVGRVRDSARSAQCLGNLRQIAAALILHTNDHRGAFPFSFDSREPGGQRNWHEKLNAITAGTWTEKNPLYLCPANVVEVTAPRFASTYAVHPGLLPQFPALPNILGPYRINQIARPSQLILVADGAQAGTGGVSDTIFTNPNPPLVATNPDLSTPIAPFAQWDVDTSPRHLRFRHAGKLNAAMADGSARSFGKNDLTFAHFVVAR